jgi:hypothetical protein
MSKFHETKKNVKKSSQKSLKEKRAEKREKRERKDSLGNIKKLFEEARE